MKFSLLSAISVFLVFGIYQTPASASITQETTGSLTEALAKAGRDSSRVIILNELAERLMEENYGQALQYADSARELAAELGYMKGLCNAYYTLGTIHTNYTLNFEKGISCLTSALQLTAAADSR